MLTNLSSPLNPLTLTGVNRPLCFYTLNKVMAEHFGFWGMKRLPWEKRSKAYKDGWMGGC